MDNMLQNEKSHFLYLNREGRWLGFSWSGLELRQDGSLGLIRLPALEGDLSPELELLSWSGGPAGITVSSDSAIYYTAPDHHLLYKINPCPVPEPELPVDGEQAPFPCPGDRPAVRSLPLPEGQRPWTPVPCLGGKGNLGTQFEAPRGLLYYPMRRALVVADSGNHRIQFFDSISYQLLDSWGQEGDEPGHFREPYSLAADGAGNIYVVDYGNRRVQKFDRWGNVLPDFWAHMVGTLQADGYALDRPGEVAVGGMDETVEVYILDYGKKQIFVFDSAGHVLRAPFGDNILSDPMGLAARDNVIYVGDNLRRRIFQFNPQAVFAGEAVRYEGPVAALALDGDGGLLVLAHSELAPLRLAAQGGFSRKGSLWGGPFYNPGELPQEWHRLKARLEPLKADAHIQLFLYCSSAPDLVDPGTGSPPWDGQAIVDSLDCLVQSEGAPACDHKWVRMPLDATEVMIQAIQTRSLPPGQWEYLSYVWVGAEFSGEGLGSPVLSQIWLEFDHETYLCHLPPLFRENDRSRQYLGRFLSLFESLYDETEEQIRSLSRLFDPLASPPDFLPWLAGWLGFELIDAWHEAKKRQAIRGAFALHAQRGTLAGIQAAVRLFTGVEVRIEDPIQETGWWSLPSGDGSSLSAENSILGFSTILVSSEAQGAVAGTTAVLDGSHLITDEELGAPLFSETAHQFIVQVYRGAGYSEQALAQVAAILDLEKPAHTRYYISTIEPMLRLGYQARIGIDTIIAGPKQPSALDSSSIDREGWLLGGEPPGRIGESSYLGQTARLTG